MSDPKLSEVVCPVQDPAVAEPGSTWGGWLQSLGLPHRRGWGPLIGDKQVRAHRETTLFLRLSGQLEPALGYGGGSSEWEHPCFLSRSKEGIQGFRKALFLINWFLFSELRWKWPSEEGKWAQPALVIQLKYIRWPKVHHSPTPPSSERKALSELEAY